MTVKQALKLIKAANKRERERVRRRWAEVLRLLGSKR